MQHRDEAQLRQLRIRVEEELTQARAELARGAAPSIAVARLGDRLDEIERELERLQRSKGRLFRGRRRKAELGLLLSERLLLDDLGYDSYADFALATGRTLRPDDAAGATEAALARLEHDSDQQRLADIEQGVLDLDWLANGGRELGVGELPAVQSEIDDELVEHGPPLDAWRNPYAEGPAPGPKGGGHVALPHLDTEDLGPSDLPYGDESD
jgi:hypothetical protein